MSVKEFSVASGTCEVQSMSIASAIAAVSVAEAEGDPNERLAAESRRREPSRGPGCSARRGGMDLESMRTFGLSGLMGACSGCASKRAGRFIIFGVRTVFASLQPATQYGYVTVHWSNLKLCTVHSG